MLDVQDVLRSKGGAIFHVAPTATVLDALREMAARNCGALLVLDDGRPVGIVSERDYARKVALMDRRSAHTLVREIMEVDVVEVPVQTSVECCMVLMTERRARHLLARKGETLAGVISIGDVVKALIDEQKCTIEQLEHYITGH